MKVGDDLTEVALEALERQNHHLENDDVLAFASKIVSYSEGRMAKLGDIAPSGKARELSSRFGLQPEFAELVLHEAEAIYGGVEKAILTLKNGILTANAGIDNKNAPPGFAVLWPSNPQKSAEDIRWKIKHRTGKAIAVLIVDSGLIPLRIGTIGLAIAAAGFRPIRDLRGEKDLYGKPLVITRHALADDLASAAHLLMGEGEDKTPIVLIRNAPVNFDDSVHGGADMMMPINECIFMSAFIARVRDSE